MEAPGAASLRQHPRREGGLAIRFNGFNAAIQVPSAIDALLTYLLGPRGPGLEARERSEGDPADAASYARAWTRALLIS